MTELQAALLLAQMESFPEQVARRDENGRRLSRLLRDVPGILPMERHAKVTTQSAYCYSFRFDPSAWDGIPVADFRKALNAETGLSAGSCYEPLNDCSLYKPHTKPRHRLNDEYWRAIDPQRFRLPVCERAFREESVVIHHPFLLADATEIQTLADAVGKIREHRQELRGVE
jgi:L-glutamine:2-deoxy-scyllo-inosose/3-amino-2,3-dideoxy-scyllo-inosose aminotransferase